MLDRMVEKARQQEIFSREDTPTEKRVLGAFLSHAGLSFRKIEPFVGCCYEAIRDWFHRCKHLFEPDCQARQAVAVDETKIEIDGTEHYAWATVDCATRSIGNAPGVDATRRA
jgi:putative transposase